MTSNKNGKEARVKIKEIQNIVECAGEGRAKGNIEQKRSVEAAKYKFVSEFIRRREQNGGDELPPKDRLFLP